MRHLLTIGLEVAPAQAAPLPQLNGATNQASPVEKVGYYGYRRYGYYPRNRYYWRHRYYRPYPTATIVLIVMAIGTGLIIAVGGSPFQDQDRPASRRS